VNEPAAPQHHKISARIDLKARGAILITLTSGCAGIYSFSGHPVLPLCSLRFRRASFVGRAPTSICSTAASQNQRQNRPETARRNINTTYLGPRLDFLLQRPPLPAPAILSSFSALPSWGARPPPSHGWGNTSIDRGGGARTRTGSSHTH
jgi:hypothetical protein